MLYDDEVLCEQIVSTRVHLHLHSLSLGLDGTVNFNLDILRLTRTQGKNF